MSSRRIRLIQRIQKTSSHRWYIKGICSHQPSTSLPLPVLQQMPLVPQLRTPRLQTLRLRLPATGEITPAQRTNRLLRRFRAGDHDGRHGRRGRSRRRLDRSDRRGGSGGGEDGATDRGGSRTVPDDNAVVGGRGAGGLVDFDGVDGPVGVCEGRGVVLDKGAAGGCFGGAGA